jgi:hypothetical protein
MPATASAEVLEAGEFQDSYSFVEKNFCDVQGLKVRIDGAVDGRFLVKTQGSDGLVYFAEHVNVVETFTNVATREFVTSETSSLNKDLKVTDNGDGTLTILVLATGSATVYDESGAAIARNPGQVRFEILVDHAGTPSDPADDVFLEDLGLVKGSTGRSDDFCTAVVAAIG